jgi:hypothetical protein
MSYTESVVRRSGPRAQRRKEMKTQTKAAKPCYSCPAWKAYKKATNSAARVVTFYDFEGLGGDRYQVQTKDGAVLLETTEEAKAYTFAIEKNFGSIEAAKKLAQDLMDSGHSETERRFAMMFAGANIDFRAEAR